MTSLGHIIQIEAGTVAAIHEQTTDVHRVTFDDGEHSGTCELAQLVGNHLMDDR